MALEGSKIIGETEPAIQLKKMISVLGGTPAPVLITGPTGCGKELVAEALHETSRRKGKFVALNCAAIPSELVEAELFGFEKGAFTGAIKANKGKFEEANGGTLFLDEIGDMPSSVQTKLLRVLENSTISRVGGSAEIKLNVRIIGATHKNLESLVTKGTFREDLLYRLNVFPISVPSLKERCADIPLLFDHFVKIKRQPSPVLTEEAKFLLKSHDWPGNIRELKNVVERAVTFFANKPVTAYDVENFLIKFSSSIIDKREEQDEFFEAFDHLSSIKIPDIHILPKVPPLPDDFASWFETHNSVDLRRLLRDIEIVLIKAALQRNNDNSSEAAKDLKLQRTTLIEKVKKYGL